MAIEKLRVLLDLYLKHRHALNFGLAMLLTAGGESIFSNVVFRCPCDHTWNLCYGLVFLLMPAGVLAVLGILLKTRMWPLCSNCCKPAGRSCPGHCWLFCKLLFSVLFLPVTWIAIALLEGSYYVCISSGSSTTAQRLCDKIPAKDTYGEKQPTCLLQMALVPCKSSELLPEMQKFQDVLKAQSQVIGWILIGSVSFLLLVCTLISHCCLTVGFQEVKFWKIYIKQEKESFEKEATEHAAELAKHNVKCFFTSPSDAKPSIPYTPTRENWKEISLLYTFPEEKYYSLLHKCACEPKRL